MHNASAESQEMNASIKNNPPTPSNNVMVNPENLVNPDSKPVAAAQIISIDDLVSRCSMDIRLLQKLS